MSRVTCTNHVMPFTCQTNFLSNSSHFLCVFGIDASSTVRKAVHLAATLIVISAVGAADCPEECVCMWKNGKETTECINRDKDSIPQGIEPSTQASQVLFHAKVQNQRIIYSFHLNIQY